MILAATTVPSSEARVYSVWVGIFAGRLSQRMSGKDKRRVNSKILLHLPSRQVGQFFLLSSNWKEPSGKQSISKDDFVRSDSKKRV